MTSPFQNASSAFPESDSSAAGTPSQPQGRYPPPYASAPMNYSAAAMPPAHFYTHPSRASILHSSGGLGGPSSNGVDNSTRAGNVDMGDSRQDSYQPWIVRSDPDAPSLPSISRAFSMFAAMEDSTTPPDPNRFFVPSYLAGSTYVQKLEAEHKAKGDQELGWHLLDSRNGALPPGSHRGMSHSLVERFKPYGEEDELHPLPTAWSKDDFWGSLEILPGGLGIKYSGPKGFHEREHEASAVRANNFMPPQCGIYYYEVQILSGKRDDLTVAIGFATKTASLSRPVGWEPEAWGYHGDDGRCFTGQNVGRHYGPSFNTGDTIGCGVNFRDNVFFFTRNGKKLGEIHHDFSKIRLYPAISLKKPGEEVRVNFGQSPFIFNIDDMMRDQRTKIYQQVEESSAANLEPGMDETDLIQALVLQYLQHDGYVETARAFAEDMKVQNEALNLDPKVKVAGVNIKDDEDANNRQRIRRAILEGDIDRALKYTNAYYPRVLQDNEQAYFKLRCRRFIEMVRKAAQLRMAGDQRKSNGHDPDMELDSNGADNAGWDETMETDDGESQAELLELEGTMLEYGQLLQAEYANDPRKEVSQALGDIWALVAYSNPLKEPLVSHLLDRSGRVAVAEELNSAILLSLGKSSRAALETVYAQTTVMLEDLRSGGGDGSFVSVRDIVDEIPVNRDT